MHMHAQKDINVHMSMHRYMQRCMYTRMHLHVQRHLHLHMYCTSAYVYLLFKLYIEAFTFVWLVDQHTLPSIENVQRPLRGQECRCI